MVNEPNSILIRNDFILDIDLHSSVNTCNRQHVPGPAARDGPRVAFGSRDFNQCDIASQKTARVASTPRAERIIIVIMNPRMRHVP